MTSSRVPNIKFNVAKVLKSIVPIVDQSVSGLFSLLTFFVLFTVFHFICQTVYTGLYLCDSSPFLAEVFACHVGGGEYYSSLSGRTR